jgi:hypothetical protein
MLTATKSNVKTGPEPPGAAWMQCNYFAVRRLLDQKPGKRTTHPSYLHGVLKFQRALSLLGSNLVSVGVLPPTAVRARGSLELGTALGMMR